MTRIKSKSVSKEVQALFDEHQDILRELVQKTVEEFMLAEMSEFLGAENGKRSPNRCGYRNGYYNRDPITRLGKIELQVPRDREGRFRTELFERYQHSEKAFIATLAQMYIEGVSTRKVRKITMKLYGHEFSASTVSRMTSHLDIELDKLG